MANSDSAATSVVRRPPSVGVRASGILLHPTSLPGGAGVGDLGRGAFGFVDFLAAAGQTLWQIMPLGPVGLGNSPYAARSAFAGNPLLVDLDALVKRGWLDQAQLAPAPTGPAERVRFDDATAFKKAAIAQAYQRFCVVAASTERTEFEQFCARHASWLDDFALFIALKEVHGGSAWFQWDEALVQRRPEALAAAGRDLDESIRAQKFAQYLFFDQWGKLKRHAAERGVRLIGDLPIFVAHDSADVWVHQDIFFLDGRGNTTVVAGVPPDLFSATGQRWGNPLYRWDRLAALDFDWWIQRFRSTLEVVDVVRLDHFRGFESYWEVPAAEETAQHGRWAPGPGAALFEALATRLGPLPIIVEDLGLITPRVEQLRDQLGYPGMKVLQFAFGGEATNPYLPHNYHDNFAVYTGTHDNDTTVGWFASLDETTRDAVRRYIAVDGHDIAWDLIRCALASVAELAIIPLQDVLALGNEARMNFPGSAGENWSWRYREDQLRPDHTSRLADLTALYGRSPAKAAGKS